MNGLAEVTITGSQEISDALYRYSQQFGDYVAIGALRTGMNYLKGQVAAAAPAAVVHKGKTVPLRQGFRVYKSKIHAGKMSGDLIGVYLSLKRGKDSPFYGKFQEYGWNVRGKDLLPKSRVERHKIMHAAFGAPGLRNGRKTMPGIRTIAGKYFVRDTFASQQATVEGIIVTAAETAAELLATKVGLG